VSPVLLIKALRPKQWAKNGLLLVAMVFAEQYTNPQAWTKVALGVAMFCMLSSAGYLVNDIRDIEADRKHPKKQHRPLASGAISPGLAWAMVVVLVAAGLAGSWFLLNPGFFIVAAGYLASTLSYTVWFKHAPVLDVMLIANGFLLRAVAGAEAIDAPSSPWFLVCIGFGALFIGLGKRLAEIKLLSGEAAGEHRKVLAEYSIDMLQQFITITVACSMISYALYTFDGGHDASMMLTLPFFIYGVFRYLYLVEKGEGGDPTSIFVGDKPLLLCMGLFVAVTIAVLQFGNGAAG